MEPMESDVRMARIARVAPATCLDHAEVVLETTGSDVRRHDVRIRVDANSARAIHAELAGLPSDVAMFIDMLRVYSHAVNAPFQCIELTVNHGDAYGRIIFRSGQSCGGVGRLPAGLALLLATRLDLPLRITPSAVPAGSATELPPAIQSFLEGLDLGESDE